MKILIEVETEENISKEELVKEIEVTLLDACFEVTKVEEITEV